MNETRTWGRSFLDLLHSYEKNLSGEPALENCPAPDDITKLLKEMFPGYDTVLAMDLETTGLRPEKDRIIQLSYIAMDLNRAEFAAKNTYIRLPDGTGLPEYISELTGITDRVLITYGRSEEEAIEQFGGALKKDKTLIIGHNLQFDLCFLINALKRNEETCGMVLSSLEKADYLDTLTIYRDRRPSPHKLMVAIREYDFPVRGSHNAVNDAGVALLLACFMGKELNDLSSYINRFGIDPKYSLIGNEIPKVEYFTQNGVPDPPEKKKNKAI